MKKQKGSKSSILFVAQSQTIGGVVTILSELLTKWPEEDNRQLLLVYNKSHGGKDIFKQITKINRRVKIEEIPLWDYHFKLRKIRTKKKNWRFLLKMLYKIIDLFLYWEKVLFFYKKCLKENVQVIFSHNGGYPGGSFNRASIVGAKFAKVPKKFLVVHNLASPLSWWRWPAGYMSDKLINWAVDKIIVVSKSCGHALQRQRYFLKPIEVIYNGISIEAKENGNICAINDVWINLPNKIAFVGQLAPRKGVDILLKAVSTLKCDFVVILFGSGEDDYVCRLHQLIKELGIKQNVIFQGYDPYVRQKLQYIDVLVLPSLAYESFGVVILEAMMWKKPVVVSNIGGMKEIVLNGETGLVVSAGDVNGLGHAIQYILDNQDLAKKFGQKGFERLITKFSSIKMINRYYQLARNGGE